MTTRTPDRNLAPPFRVQLMGLPIDGFTPEGLVDHLIAQSLAGAGGYVMTPNVDNLRHVSRCPDLLERALGADVRVADGMPLLWASHITGTPLPGRVAGSDLILSLSDALAASNRTLFLLGGDLGTAERAADVLRKRAPNLVVVGTHCPPHGFESDSVALAEIVNALCSARPDFVYMGLPFPKASALALDLRSALPATWFLGLGISFSFVCGDVQRAPRWMQQVGLEWIHRLAQEPHRLGRRYVLEGLPFVLELLLSAFLQRTYPRGGRGNQELSPPPTGHSGR